MSVPQPNSGPSEQPTPSSRRPQAAKVQLPPEAAEILASSVQVGLGAGAVGLVVGGAAGIVRSAAPVLFSLVTGAQWFALGSSYYGARQYAIRAWGGDSAVGPADKVKASALAGASAGFVGGALRGPRNILPAIAVFSLLGAGGQAYVNGRPEEPANKTKTSWLDSKWSPVKPMSDDDYAKFIEDKVLKLEVELSIIDDKLAALRAAKAQREAASSTRTDT